MRVATANRIYRFGPFTLDPHLRRLTRGDAGVSLHDRSMDVLIVLLDHAGEWVTKRMLDTIVWKDVAVMDNTIVQAVRVLRRTLGRQPDGTSYVECRKRLGYRLLVKVQCENVEPDDADEVDDSARAASEVQDESALDLSPHVSVDALLEPHRAFMTGLAAIETLGRDAVDRALVAFAEALFHSPDDAASHAGMATACFLEFEATRADLAPDVSALNQAVHHAREACRLGPSLADAWGTLAIVLYRTGAADDALAAARRAIALEPEEWRHYLRLAFVTWGTDRLRAVRRMRKLRLGPPLALGHWLAATVHVALEAFDEALEELRAGCKAQDAQGQDGCRHAAVGLHLLCGLVLAALGHLDTARAELRRELAFDDAYHVYGREVLANTWYALGALDLREGKRDKACRAFQEALTCVPGHALAAIGLAAATGRVLDPSALCPEPFALSERDAIGLATAGAVVLVLRGGHRAAARVVSDALQQTPAGQAGWMLPVEPLLNIAAHREEWAGTLAALCSRVV